MVLYDEEGNATFFDSEEVKEILTKYMMFDESREQFNEDGDCADCLIDSIQEMKKIPSILRYSLPEEFGLADFKLDGLEKKCKRHLEITE